MTGWTMRISRALAGAVTLAVIGSAAHAANCEGDRKLFPKDWKAVANETPLFSCAGRYIHLRIFLTPQTGSTLLLTVVNDKDVYRAILDPRDVDRLKRQTGLYILYSEKTCFVRGDYNGPAILSFADGSMSNGFDFLSAANVLDAFDRCEPAKPQ